MNNYISERRKSRRLARYPVPSTFESGAAAALLNLSEGGVCVWLPDASIAAVNGPLLVCFEGKASNQSLRARLAWIRPCMREPANGSEPTRAGWLAGFAFASADLAVSMNAMASEEVQVHLLPDHSGYSDNRGAPETMQPFRLDGNTISSLRTVAEDLLPVFAKHFVDLRFVLTRDRLEISAPFRPVAPPDGQERRKEHHAVVQEHYQAAKAPQLPASSAFEEKGTADAKRGWLRDRGFVLAAAATLAGVIIGLQVLGSVLNDKADRWATARALAAQIGMSAPWAGELDPASVPGWVGIQRQFGLADGDIRSLIRVLKANDRYSAGHSLYDLTKYPVQVTRALAMLTSSETRTAVGFVALKTDLGARLANGARFPDEPPGSRYYSNLDPRLLDNTVTLTVIELLHRRLDDPGVQQLLATLAGARRTGKPPVSVVRADS